MEREKDIFRQLFVKSQRTLGDLFVQDVENLVDKPQHFPMTFRVSRLSDRQLAHLDTAWLQLQGVRCDSCCLVGHIYNDSLFETTRFVLSRLELSPWPTKTTKLFEELPAHDLLSRSVCAATGVDEMTQKNLSGLEFEEFDMADGDFVPCLPRAAFKIRLGRSWRCHSCEYYWLAAKLGAQFGMACALYLSP